jgi:hypothetical protein
MANPTGTTCRAELEALSRDCLATLTDLFNLPVKDRRSTAAYVNALICARSLDFGELLRWLSRDEMKAICESLDLDTLGRRRNSSSSAFWTATASHEEAGTT